MEFASIVKYVFLAQTISYATSQQYQCYRTGGWCQDSTWSCSGRLVTGNILCGYWRNACCYPSVSRQACTCNINRGIGCTLGAPPIPGHACRCELDGPLTHPNTKCIGYVVDCNNKAAEACKNPTKGYASCRQGVFGQQGNCCGYAEGSCIIPVVSSQ